MSEAYARGQTIFVPTVEAMLSYIHISTPEDPMPNPDYPRFPVGHEDQPNAQTLLRDMSGLRTFNEPNNRSGWDNDAREAEALAQYRQRKLSW